MTRLYDRMLRRNDFARMHFNYQKIAYKHFTVLNFENAARYFIENYWRGAPREDRFNDLNSFLQLTPPFERTFLEHGLTNTYLATAVGYHITTLEIPEDRLDDFVAEANHITGESIEDYPKWTVRIFRFVEFRKREVEPSWVFTFTLDKYGTLFSHDYPQDEQGNVQHDAIEGGSIYTVFFALSLMNTKNVELIDHIPPPKLSKKHEKKYGAPLVTYKTIKVNPMRTVKRMDGDDVPSSERDIASQGIQPLHIVAGNFADYRDGPGMFGNPKLKGVFWRPQHIRGNAERGVVVKDYEVQAPEDSDHETTTP